MILVIRHAVRYTELAFKDFWRCRVQSYQAHPETEANNNRGYDDHGKVDHNPPGGALRRFDHGPYHNEKQPIFMNYLTACGFPSEERYGGPLCRRGLVGYNASAFA
jgi:hypothetical protein